jgi:hypothetical protein
MNNTVISYIRTYTPALAGLIIGALVSWGLPVPSGAKELLTAVLSGVFIAAYYAVVRWAEKRWPATGWLLGSPRQPEYHAHDAMVVSHPPTLPSGYPASMPPLTGMPPAAPQEPRSGTESDAGHQPT